VPDYPHHLPNFDYVGFHRYSLTFCTYEREEFFRSASNVDLVLQQILRAAEEQLFDLLTYCFMRDHLHVLAAGKRADADLKAFVARAKQYSGFYFKKATRKRLWQRYGYEHTLRDDEATVAVIAYIVNNPVRAGYVMSPADYPFWGSTVYSREEILEFLQMVL